MVRVPYNKLLTNLASSSRTGEYWPSVIFVRTSLRSVRTATTSGQYSPVRPSHSVSKRLVWCQSSESHEFKSCFNSSGFFQAFSLHLLKFYVTVMIWQFRYIMFRIFRGPLVFQFFTVTCLPSLNKVYYYYYYFLAQELANDKFITWALTHNGCRYYINRNIWIRLLLSQ